ncbi:MAG: IgGFc-binding protein [Anaerolineales bacterium]|nr:IgGFc-binding protein [Anaerolineales bacterium]
MKIKRHLYWITVLTLIGLLGGLGLLVQSKADEPDSKPNTQVFLPFITTGEGDTNPTDITIKHIKIAQGAAGGGRIDAFTFFIPYATESAAAQFNVGAPTTVAPNLPISTTISIAVNRDNSIIYYDQWEDTLEGDLTFPTQTTTLVWGDGDPTNNTTGLPPGVQLLGIPANDILTAGTIITLRNTVPSTPAARGTPPTIFFDGGDMLTSTGGALAVSTTFWTDIGPGILFTDAWELYPTNRWGTDYISPIGQNVIRDGPDSRGEFEVVGLNVQAVENDTVVEIDLNADGIFSNDGITDPVTTTLNMGEQLNITRTIQAGSHVRASAPVQTHLFASDPDSRYEARGYTLVPFDQWTNDYLAPRASDGDFWLYNPNNSFITVTVQSITTTTSLVISPTSTVRYPIDPTPPISDADMSGATGLHFTSNGPVFYGIAALDAASTQDWGYALLPTANLTSQTLIGLGVGNVDVLNSLPCPPPPRGTGRESRIYITALNDTTFFVDVNNDGAPDIVNVTDDNGVAIPSGPGNGYPLLALQELSITDPSDCNMTGAFIYTANDTPFASVWGQDANAAAALPSIDAGTSIVPLRSLAVQKTFSLLTDVDCSGSISLGDDVRFQLESINNSATPLTSVVITDNLPPALTYIPGTTFEDSVQVPDNGSGSAYPLDGSGLNTGLLDQFSASILTYDTTVNNTGVTIINQASASSPALPQQADAVTIFVPTGSPTPLLEITETLIDPATGPVNPGQVITFNLTITNTGSTTITTLPLEETYNTSHLTFLNADPPPNVATTGVITWTDLTTISGDLQPNASVNLTLSFVVNQLLPPVSNTSLTATVRSAFRQSSPVPLTCSNNATLAFAAPAPTPTPTPTSTPTPTPTRPTDSGGNGNGNRATPTPTPIPVAAIPAAPTAPAIPVAFLPETGLREAGLERWPIAGGLILLVLAGFGLALRSRHKE